MPPMNAALAGPNPRMPLVMRNANRRPAEPAAPVAAAHTPPDRLQTADRLARNGLIDEALNRYREIAESAPKDAAPWIRIAQMHAIAGHPKEAMEAFAAGESCDEGRFTEVLKSTAWSEIADSVAISRLRNDFEAWSQNPEFAGIEKLKASLTASQPPAVVQAR